MDVEGKVLGLVGFIVLDAKYPPQDAPAAWFYHRWDPYKISKFIKSSLVGGLVDP